MIRTTMVPEQQDISIHLPLDYVGKKIEVMLYAIDEINDGDPHKPAINNAALRGKLRLTDEQYNDFQKHATLIRNEWD